MFNTHRIQTLFILAMVLIGILMLGEVVAPWVKVSFETANAVKKHERRQEQ